MLRNVGYLARWLLNTEVSFPEEDPGDPNRESAEIKSRISDLLDRRLPDILFDFDGSNYFANDTWYVDGGHLVEDYLSLCRALRSMARTGLINRDSIGRGQATLATLSDVLAREEQRVRARFPPDLEFETHLLHRWADDDAKELIARWKFHDYDWYVTLRCASEAIGTLSQGLSEIDQALSPKDRQPPIR